MIRSLHQRMILRMILAAIASLFLLSVTTWAQENGLPPLPKPKTSPTPKPKTSPTPKTNAKDGATSSTNFYREPESVPPVAFNQSLEGNLDPKTAGRLTQSSYYADYALTAKGGELLVIQLQSANSDLAVQVFDKEKNGLPISKDPRAKEFKLDTPNGALPGAGEYHVRVLGQLAEATAAPVAYTLKVKLTGLTEESYRAQLQQIITAFAPGESNVNTAIAQLEQLTRDDPSKPGAYEQLGVLYLYHRHDLARALIQIEQALKLGGAATFQISHDSQWRQPVKKQGQALGWEDQRISWLKIRADQVEVTDANESPKTLFSLGKQQIKDVLKVSNSPAIQIELDGKRNKPRFFAPNSKDSVEAEIIIKMIKTQVLHKD